MTAGVKLARVKLQVANVALMGAAVPFCINPNSLSLNWACQLESKIRRATTLSLLPGQQQETDPPQGQTH